MTRGAWSLELDTEAVDNLIPDLIKGLDLERNLPSGWVVAVAKDLCRRLELDFVAEISETADEAGIGLALVEVVEVVVAEIPVGHAVSDLI